MKKRVKSFSVKEGHDVERVATNLKNLYCYEICQRDVRDKMRLEFGGRTIVAKDTLLMAKLAGRLKSGRSMSSITTCLLTPWSFPGTSRGEQCSLLSLGKLIARRKLTTCAFEEKVDYMERSMQADCRMQVDGVPPKGRPMSMRLTPKQDLDRHVRTHGSDLLIRGGWSGWRRRASPVFAHWTATLRDSLSERAKWDASRSQDIAAVTQVCDCIDKAAAVDPLRGGCPIGCESIQSAGIRSGTSFWRPWAKEGSGRGRVLVMWHTSDTLHPFQLHWTSVVSVPISWSPVHVVLAQCALAFRHGLSDFALAQVMLKKHRVLDRRETGWFETLVWQVSLSVTFQQMSM